jgi:hypothetical protein
VTVCHRESEVQSSNEGPGTYKVHALGAIPSSTEKKPADSDRSTILRTAAALRDGSAPYCVPWIGSYELTRKLSAAAEEAHAIYFCSEKIHALAGEGAGAWNDYKRTHSGASPEQTLFEFPSALDALNKAGIRLLCKLSDASENEAVFRAHGATSGTLAIFAPNGEKLAAFTAAECTGEALPNFLTQQLKAKLAAAKQRK